MGHSIQALVIPDAAAPVALVELPQTRPIPIGQRLQIVPITDQAFDALRERFPDVGGPADPEFWKLSGPLMRLAQQLSQFGPVAYIETEYFGGAGAQSAAVWDRGEVRMPPTQAESGPINAALRLLGVKTGTAHDEFDAIGLGESRSNEDWLERAQ